MSSDVGLYNRLTVVHAFNVLDKACKDKVMTVGISDVHIFTSVTSQKAVMRALGIIDCLAEPHLVPVLVKIMKILAKRPSRTFLETHVSLGKNLHAIWT